MLVFQFEKFKIFNLFLLGHFSLFGFVILDNLFLIKAYFALFALLFVVFILELLIIVFFDLDII